MKILLIESATGKEISLNKDITILGRNKDSDIVINNPYVSRKHCHIIEKDKKFFIEDLNTLNGTFLNHKKIKIRTELQNNDIINLYKSGAQFKFIRIKTKSSLVSNLAKIFTNKITVFFFLLIIIFSSGFISSIMIIQNKPRKNENNYAAVKNRVENFLLKYGEKKAVIDQKIIDRIEYYIKDYKTRNLSSFLIGFERRKQYISMIENTFASHNIPTDISYLAFVESYYKPDAYNRSSGARGMWQLMPGTARQYGLTVNRKTDERTDPVKSTRASAAYISDLIAVFGVNSFTLAIAAYNVGEGSLQNSLKKIDDPINNRNFWYLYKNDMIPYETKEYVLKVFALIILTEDYENESSLAIR